MPEESPEHRTYEDGAREALALAIATLVGLLPPDKKAIFMTGYPQNVLTWESQALPSSEVADEWLNGLQSMAQSIERLVEP